MIIAGNSHVSVFKHGLALPLKPQEPVSVHWVGALEIGHFDLEHPAARKVRALFATEAGWKFLLLGNHDLFKVAAGTVSLEGLLAQYRRVFTELSAQGRFGWMVGLQQTENVQIPGCTPANLRSLAGRFVNELSSWCRQVGLTVINPLPLILDAKGLPDPTLLMADGLHLKPDAAPLYLEAIAEAIGETVESRPAAGPDFAPETEPESFCTLVLTELGLPIRSTGGLTGDELTARLLTFVQERLVERGLELELEADTDFTVGLLDSLDLVETYAFASEVAGIDLDFDVNLMELGTVRRLSEFVLAHMSAPSGLTLEDFHSSMRGGFDTAERVQVLAAEERIAAMGPDRYEQLVEVIETVTGGQHGYGIMWFWRALVEQRLGHVDRAFELLDVAERSAKRAPLTAARIDHYRQAWLKTRTSAALPDKKARNVLLVETDPARLQSGIRAYLQAFEAGDDVCLHVLAGSEVEAVHKQVLAVITDCEQTPESIADLSLLDISAQAPDRAALMRQVDLVIGAPDVVSEARMLGIEALTDVDPRALRQALVGGYLVTAVVSAYNSERFLEGRLENLVQQSLYAKGQLEILIIDSASPQDERSIAEAYMRRHAHFRYVRTDERETVYEAWNRGIELATGRYWINANSDDRFAEDALEWMVVALEADPTLDAVYGNWTVTLAENDTLESDTPKFVFAYPDFFPPLLLYYQITSHAALIRRCAFDRIGRFDGDLKVFGDREWMLRFATQGLKARHVPGVVGLYLESPTSVERSESTAASEFGRLRERFSTPEALARLFAAPPPTQPDEIARLYAAAGALGHRFYDWNGTPVSDYGYAARLFRRALEFDAHNALALSNLAVILCLGGEHAKAAALLRHGLEGTTDERAALAANLLAAEAGHRSVEEFIWLCPASDETSANFHDEPLVSVIVPTFNRPDQAVEAIASILTQTYRNLEVIVVNDAGTGLEDRLLELPGSEKVTYVRCGRNRERSHARNLGLKIATGKYVTYLDDDDLLYPHHVATLVRHLEQTGLKVAYTDAHRAHTQRQGECLVVTRRDVPHSVDFDRDRLLVYNYLPILTVMHARECLETVGMFDESLRTHEDWELWIRLSRLFEFGHVPQVTCEYSWRTDGTSTSSGMRADFLRTMRVIYQRYRGLAGDRPQLLAAQEKQLRALESDLAEELQPPDCSIIIPCFNQANYTRLCLEALIAHTPEDRYEVILVDNASKDGTGSLLDALEGDVTILRNDENLGFARACNQGAARAKGRYLLFLNNDTEAHPGWFQPLIELLDREPELAAVGPKLLFPDGTLQHAGVEVVGGDGAPLVARHRYYRQPANHAEANARADVKALTGAALMVRRDLFEAVGGFEEAYWNGYEDIDLCFKLLDRGYRLAYEPSSCLTHHESVSGPERWIKARANTRLLNERWAGRITADRLPESAS